MAESLGPLSDPRAESTMLEINQQLQSQLAQRKQDFRDLREKFLVSESTAYILANQLQKYKCGECKGIVESVLGEKLQFEEGKLTEEAALVEKLRKCDILIQGQAQELTQLQQKIQEGRKVSVVLNQCLQDLLSHNDPANYQGQGFREQLAEGHRLAERLAQKLSPENHGAEEDEEEKASLDPRELQEKEEVDDVRQDSLEEQCVTLSTHRDLSHPCQTPDSTPIPAEEYEVCSALDVAKTQKDQKDEEREGSTAPRLSRELQEKEEGNDVRQDSLDEQCLTLSTQRDLSDSCHSPDSTLIPSEEHEVCSAFDVAKNREAEEDAEEKEPPSKMNDQRREKDREFDFLIRVQARELSQLRQKIGEGRDFAILLNQHLKDLLTHGDLDNSQGQGFQEQLAEGRRLSEGLISKLSQENHEDKDEEQLESLTPRKYRFLIHDHARKLTQIRQQLREGREVSILLNQHLKDLLTHGDLDNSQGQGFREQLAEGRRLAERLVCKLSPETQEDDEDEEEQESLTPSLERELQEKEHVKEVPQDPLGKQYLTPSSRRDLSSSGEALRSTACVFNETKVSLALDAAKLGLTATLRMKNPPSEPLKGDALEGSAANKHGCQVIGHGNTSSVMKQRILQRKARLSKWRLACRFPGLQA
ncbi:neuroblastoma breakpoint family member 12-like isoform X2 [Diceros bicornis minor]|uniref:neuroblastoma breakpoint family member 12-like isoform X2 n=1 Tax=Diceros bicornis minor TaxID=77932 RepID=UPI0026F20AB1|nr:neuroblastoma breakpoint family member 12-like isoform X2 [Diceros bicornis minor]XP_058394932.1 neuroblastoma breakpoint family member 12-like isoform X2 [Diceros bicornis minor]